MCKNNDVGGLTIENLVLLDLVCKSEVSLTMSTFWIHKEA